MRRSLALKIGISGVRGIVGEALTPQLVTSFAAAFGTHIGAGPVLVGTDSRPSRDMVKQAATAGLLSVGCAPVDLGILPVPSLQHHIRHVGALGGICVTASHNPIEWNALKFFGADGILLRPRQAAELTDLYHQGSYPRVGGPELSAIRCDATAIAAHRATVLASVDVEAIRRRRFRVAVDCCNGAASVATLEFLRELGCEVVSIYTNPDEPFPHNPEPVPANIGDLCRLVRDSGADIGFVQDADADRLSTVLAGGEPMGEEATLAVATRHFLARTQCPVAVNVSTSRMIDDVAAERGCRVVRARVGEVNVVEKMIESGARIGGEGNGGIISLGVNPCRDSFVGMSLILEAMALEEAGIADLRSRIPSYAFVKDKISVPSHQVATSLRRFQDAHRGDLVDLTDGIKVIWSNRWLHVRSSNTEPIIRVIAEAPEPEEARSLVAGAFEVLGSAN